MGSPSILRCAERMRSSKVGKSKVAEEPKWPTRPELSPVSVA